MMIVAQLPWDERYARGEHSGQPPLAFLAELAARLPAGTALDLACGAGRHARLLADLGWRVTAVDGSGVALSGISPPVVTVLADLEKGEFAIEPGAWDLIVDTCYWQPALLHSIRAGVRPGGRVAMAIPIAGTMNPAYTVAPGELATSFEGWRVEHLREEGRLSELVAVKPG